MPYLSPEFIATWYHFVDRTGKVRIFQSHKETLINEVDPKKFMQGDIGTHVMSVGGIYYQTDVTSPSVIVEDAAGTTIADIFDIIKTSFNTLRDPTAIQNAIFLLESAEIRISKEEGVDCSATFISDQPGAFNPVFGPPEDYIARTASWYDCEFFATSPALTSAFRVVKATISLKADIKKEYFVGTSQIPYLCIAGYTVEGSLTVLSTPAQFASFTVDLQTPGELSANGIAGTALQIGNSSIAFGSASLNASIARNMNAGEITTADIKFKTYARYTTPVS